MACRILDLCEQNANVIFFQENESENVVDINLSSRPNM